MQPDLPPMRVELLHEFLASRGWESSGEGTKFAAYVPPPSLHLGEFELTVPRYGSGPGTEVLVRRLAETLSDIHRLSLSQLAVVLSAPSTVAAIRFEGEDIRYGSMPLARFEAVMDRFKKSLLDMASFVITDEIVVGKPPLTAHEYVDHCRVLQSEVGSYVAKVQLPGGLQLTHPTLFKESPVTSDDVNDRAADIVHHLFARVGIGGREAFSESALHASLEVVNVTVIKDLVSLVERARSDELTFTFLSASKDRTIRTGYLSDQRRKILTEYAEFAREKLAGDIKFDMTGHVVELRSRSAERKHNYVGVRGIWNDRVTYVAFLLKATAYAAAVRAHGRNARVRVAGAAKYMRTQMRITKLDYFEVLEQD